MSSVFDAHSFAVIAHAGQLDKAGQPYIRHLERVANAAVARAGHARATDRLDIDPMRVMQAAILHDVLEDTPTTPAALQAAGFPPDVVRMVRRLTKSADAVPYAERIALVAQSGDLGAILIKMSDNEDNLSPDRTLPDGAHLRARYAAGFETLRQAAARLDYTGP